MITNDLVLHSYLSYKITLFNTLVSSFYITTRFSLIDMQMMLEELCVYGSWFMKLHKNVLNFDRLF
jgi:hypothetical protein